MTKQLSTTGIIAAIIVVALAVPMFAFACHSSAPAVPSVLTDLSAAFARFGR